VVPNFLPYDLAVKWRDTMTREWDARYQCQTDTTEATACAVDNDNGWRYATNNNGKLGKGISNAKVRSLDNISARNATAQRMKQANQFSYAKWELDHDHELVQEMAQTFLSKEVVDLVTHVLSQTNNGVDLAQQELSDLFVTQYSTGDFLSAHNDGVSGTFAFVLSLMDGPPNRQWQDDFGGTLRFQCEAPAPGWCEALKPTFNTAIFFQTRGSHGGVVGPMHEVLPVAYRAELEGFRRFGVTGWYMDRKDEMSDSIKAERDKMRGK
jgi:Rps23 Pro-64 3,4-dihydroxylase Tpa1-like proline 4-hydroxylase